MTLHTNNILGDLYMSKLQDKTYLDYSPVNKQEKQGKKYKGNLIYLDNQSKGFYKYV